MIWYTQLDMFSRLAVDGVWYDAHDWKWFSKMEWLMLIWIVMNDMLGDGSFIQLIHLAKTIYNTEHSIRISLRYWYGMTRLDIATTGLDVVAATLLSARWYHDYDYWCRYVVLYQRYVYLYHMIWCTRLDMRYVEKIDMNGSGRWIVGWRWLLYYYEVLWHGFGNLILNMTGESKIW